MRASTVNSAELVEKLERQLMESLRPVQPRTEFIDRLHSRLTTPQTMMLERRESAVFGLLLVSVSLLTGVFLIWLRRQL
jgi:uncharacterized iron-regulated membrane protein